LVAAVCRYAASRLSAQRSIAGWVGEATGGLSYLEFIRGLAKRVEEDWEGVQVRLINERLCCGLE
jgi:Zn-dependent M16 (insulinase) family peptidase